MQETKCLVPDKLITVEDDLLINGKKFPYQTQWNYDRIHTDPFECCQSKQYYVVICGGVEYFIPIDRAFPATLKPATEGIDDYWEDIKYQAADFPDEALLTPDTKKIMTDFNTIRFEEEKVR